MREKTEKPENPAALISATEIPIIGKVKQILTGCVFTGGEGPPLRQAAPHLAEAAVTVAADSGLLLARRLGVFPDYLVGDMDSLPDRENLTEFPSGRVLRHPRDKDFTDTELGVRLLREKGCGRIVILGAGGGRLDHLLAVHALFSRDPAPDLWLTDGEEVGLVRDRYVLRRWKGRLVSFFPLGPGPVRMRSRGLQWPLDTLEWGPGDFGVSNRVVEDPAEVVMVSGRLLAVRSWRGEGMEEGGPGPGGP